MLASRLLRSRWLGTVAVTAAILTAGGVLGTSAYAGEDEHRALPAHVFSPYFQAYTDASPAQQSAASGARYLTMAFLQTAQTGSCDILWNGDPTKPVAWSTFGPDIAKIRAHGGDVIPSAASPPTTRPPRSPTAARTWTRSRRRSRRSSPRTT